MTSTPETQHRNITRIHYIVRAYPFHPRTLYVLNINNDVLTCDGREIMTVTLIGMAYWCEKLHCVSVYIIINHITSPALRYLKILTAQFPKLIKLVWGKSCASAMCWLVLYHIAYLLVAHSQILSNHVLLTTHMTTSRQRTFFSHYVYCMALWGSYLSPVDSPNKWASNAEL